MGNEELRNNIELEAVLFAEISSFGSFRRLTATGTLRGEENRFTKATIRPLLLKEVESYQFTCFDRTKSYSQNYAKDELRSLLVDLLTTPFNRYHIHLESEQINIHITKKRKICVSRSRTDDAKKRPPDLDHDRVKRYPIPRGVPDVFLQKIGIMDASGHVIPRMQNKYKQINEFLRLVDETIGRSVEDAELRIVDCGCGNAYLTFAAYHYYNHLRSLPTQINGVDANPDSIARCCDLQDSLGWDGMFFRESSIEQYIPTEAPDIVMSLHACDTATDEAIALGVQWQSRVIFSAPCCQKELRTQIRAPAFSPVLRHGILKQRMADLITDACRAQILRILGYKTDVVEFIDSKHTPKNLMIRAVLTQKTDRQAAVDEYTELTRYWNVRPALERFLAEELTPYFSRR